MTHHCPVCGCAIASWVVRENFDCPECHATLTSSHKKTLRRSLAVALFAWLVFLAAMQQYVGSWGVAVVVSLEGGGILSAVVAAFYYRTAVKLKVVVNPQSELQESD